MEWWWYVATGIIIVWVALVAIYLIALINYIMHNRDGLDTYDRLESRDEGGTDEPLAE